MAATPSAQLAPPKPISKRLTRRQKAAIIVRFLLNEGAEVPLSDLPDGLQEVLTTQMGSMRYVDRSTLADVLGEFASEIEAMGLTFPQGIAGALSALDGSISPQTAARLRKEAGVRQFGDPWEQVCTADPDKVLSILETESTEVAAILLSKLDVSLAATLLGRLPGQTARRITYAVSQTSAATPDAVDRIGLALAAQLHDSPKTAFDKGPVERVGAILNYSQATTRDDVLTGLDETDEDFAKRVRRAIFTFANIPDRIDPKEVSTITRDLSRADLILALAGALQEEGDLADAANFLINNHSKRMADTLRDEIQDAGKVGAKESEAAMTEVVNNIRTLEASGEIILLVPEDDE